MTKQMERAREICGEIREMNLSDLSPRAWAPEGADFARVYTGWKGEYLHIDENLTVTPSRLNIAWSHELDKFWS